MKPLSERELSWRTVLSGIEDAMQDLPTPSLWHARGITRGRRATSDPETLEDPGLITTCVDMSVHPGLLQMLQARGDAEVDHTWMWRLNPDHGAVMEPESTWSACLVCCLPDRIPGHGCGPRDLLRGG